MLPEAKRRFVSITRLLKNRRHRVLPLLVLLLPFATIMVTQGQSAPGALMIGTGLLVAPSAMSADSHRTPTFTKDVAPIFQQKCESCHRADSVAPMSFVTYEEARPWA